MTSFARLAIPVAAAAILLPSVATAQGTAGHFARNSLASPLVQGRAQNRIYTMDDVEDANCKERKFTGVDVVVQPETVGTGSNAVRKWQEQWLLDRCGKTVNYRVFYNEIGQGGVSFSVVNVDRPPEVIAKPAPTERVLTVTKPFMEGEDVRAVQRALADAKIKVGVDGIYGPGTRKAVIEFQKKKGLRASGEVDSETRQALGIS